MLHLIAGDLDRQLHLGQLTLLLAPVERPPFAVAAVAVEQDTALLLDEEQLLLAPEASLGQIEQALGEFQEPPPGTVMLRGGEPLRLYAVVHDLEQSPSWREEWILAALENILRLCQRRQLGAIALPLLGSHFGSLTPQRFIELLCRAIHHLPPTTPLKIWLVVERAHVHPMLDELERHC